MTDMPTTNCPYCDIPCDADWVDVGVGMIQCGPYHCIQCGASEIGPNDDTFDPFRTIFGDENRPQENDRMLTERESKTGWYEPDSAPGSSANVIGGKIVSHGVMKSAYRQEFTGNPLWSDKSYVESWYQETRKPR